MYRHNGAPLVRELGLQLRLVGFNFGDVGARLAQKQLEQRAAAALQLALLADVRLRLALGAVQALPVFFDQLQPLHLAQPLLIQLLQLLGPRLYLLHVLAAPDDVLQVLQQPLVVRAGGLGLHHGDLLNLALCL
jgi:hypothetical protein